MSDYLKQAITYNQAHAAFVSFSGTGEPIDRLREIIEVSDDPIPYAEDDDDSSPNSARRKMRTWSSYEDVRLLAGIYRYGIDNWAPISKFVGNGRTRAQCAQRWARGLNPRICKDTWDPTEDMRLMQLVQQYGDKSWTRIAASLGNRSDVQCRYHYHQLTKDMNQMMQISRQQPQTMSQFPQHQQPPQTAQQPPQTAQQPPQTAQQPPQQQPPPQAFPSTQTVFPSCSTATSASDGNSANSSTVPHQQQVIPIRPYFAMRPPPRFSMPMISPSPQFEFMPPQPQPQPQQPQLQQQQPFQPLQQIQQTQLQTQPLGEFENELNRDEAMQNMQPPQVLPRVFDQQNVGTRRASHFLIPPIDPKFEMPMKACEPPVRFEQIEKMEHNNYNNYNYYNDNCNDDNNNYNNNNLNIPLQNKNDQRRSSFSSNIDDFLNKFQ